MMHTKGPWKAERDLCVVDWSGRDIARLFSTIGNYEREAANARLVAAACTSYDRHCGERAVEAAEADLLGKALDKLRKCASEFHDDFHAYGDPNDPKNIDGLAMLYREIHALLALAKVDAP